MGNAAIDVGDQTNPKADNTRICGAMAEQRHADGRGENDSAPQKLVHLVGCRDPNARKPWIRPDSISQKA